jgi:hypothetical protein
MPTDPLETEPKIADIVHRLLRDRSVDREFGVEDNLRDVGLTSLDMTNSSSLSRLTSRSRFLTARSRRRTSPQSRRSATSSGRFGGVYRAVP